MYNNDVGSVFIGLTKFLNAAIRKFLSQFERT